MSGRGAARSWRIGRQHLRTCRCVESCIGLAECPSCPTCGRPVQSWDDDVQEITASDGGPAWPGGPWLSIPNTACVVRTRLRGRTAQPCGHDLPLDFDLTYRQYDVHLTKDELGDGYSI
jgi:hypothetical protein